MIRGTQLDLFATPPDRRRVGPSPPSPEVVALAAGLDRRIRLGTSTWSFPGWQGLVYDRAVSEAVLAQDGLAAYAAHPLFAAVGVDRGYYRPLSAGEALAYAEEVPADFRFVVKAPEELTLARFDGHPRHGTRRGANPRFLDGAYARDEVVGPLVAGFGLRLGVVVFQFPPQDLGTPGRFGNALRRFFRALPRGPHYAVEVRSRAIFGEVFAEALAASGALPCLSHHPALPDLRQQADVTLALGAPALVVRWNLGHGLGYEEARGRFAPFDRLVAPDPVTRRTLAELCRAARRERHEVFVTINNKAEGSAPWSVIELAREIVAGSSDVLEPTNRTAWGRA